MTADGPADRRAIADRLRALREELTHLATASAESRKPIELDQSRVGRLSRMDALQDQAMQQAVEGRRQREIARIDAALARIEIDEYGLCTRCGDEIAGKRLDLDPAAPLCIDCAAAPPD
ncbi:MAG: TraR/DksA family transcriptional regulator [Alphaproteobacteria bacterium]